MSEMLCSVPHPSILLEVEAHLSLHFHMFFRLGKCPLSICSQERLPQSKPLPLAMNRLSITETKTFSESPWNGDLRPPWSGSHLCHHSLLSVPSQGTEHNPLRSPHPHEAGLCCPFCVPCRWCYKTQSLEKSPSFLDI